MSDFRNYLEKQLENPNFKKEWYYLKPEYNTMQAMIDARKKMQHDVKRAGFSRSRL